jgi:hypothetical protein
LNIPLPIIGKNTVNYGITVTMSNEVFQLFEKTTWKCRIEHQIKNLPTDLAFDIMERISSEGTINQNTKQEYFPSIICLRIPALLFVTQRLRN